MKRKTYKLRCLGHAKLGPSHYKLFYETICLGENSSHPSVITRDDNLLYVNFNKKLLEKG